MAEHGIKLSELIEKYGGVQTWKSGVTRPLKYINTAESSEQEPEQSGWFGNLLLDSLKFGGQTALGLIPQEILPDGVSGFAGGTLAEMLGNGLQAMGDPDRTLAARYNPALASVLRSIGGTAQDIADSALEYGASQVKPRNNDEYLGSLRNQFDSGFYGVMQGDASMFKADKSVSAFEEAIRRLADENAIDPSLSWDYIFSPHGLTRSFGNMAGSMGAILPSMALAPESAFLTPANAITRFLINRGAYGLAKRTAGNLPNYLRYAATSAPAEALSEGGHVRTENLAQGVSDEEATRRGWNTAAANLPILLGSNLVEAGLFGTPFSQGSALSKLAQAGLRTGGNALQQGTEEALQKAVSNAQTGKEYGLTPFGWTPDQWQDFAEGFAGTLPMGIVGSGAHAISDFRRPAETDEERTAREAYEQGSDENISVGDFSTRAEKASKQHQHDKLRAWADKESGGQMSDDVFNSIVRNAQAYGIPVKRAIATAIAENGGKQEGVSPAGAIGVMQLMPSTAQGLGVDPNDTEQNIRGGMKYLRQMYDQYGDWNLAHAAYNVGPSNVTDRVPQNGETEHYVARINGLLSESPSYYKDTVSPSNDITYLGNNGKGEGRYWVRQGDHVSFDGAQPDLLNAMDILGKKFFDDTGVMLVASAGTNGSHPSNGSAHGHDAGWKVDIVDAGANGVGLDANGALFNSDFTPTEYCKEFIEFGRNLGLGMNLEGEGTSNVHIDVALDGHQWDGNGDNAGGFSLDRVRKNARGTAQSSEDTSAPPPQEETPKPLFDLNAEDEQTQKLLERFANERIQSEVNAENPDRGTLGFFTGLFNDAGEFQNTEANRAALRERYGGEITAWANEILKQESPAQPAAPAKTQSSPKPQGKAKATKGDIVAATDNFLERLRTDRPNANALLELEEARRAGDVAKMESILRQNNVEITPVESTAPDNPSPQPPVQSENVVQNNQPPENILTSEQETAQPQQETNTVTPKAQPAQTKTELAHINRVSKATNLANKSRAALNNIVDSIQWLAAQNNIVIPAKDLTKLKKRNPKTISEWRDRLTKAGALTVKPAQETTSAPPSPQQTEQPPAAETTATPKETPLQAALRRARQILDTQEYTPNAHPLLETQQRQDTEQDVFDLIPTTEDDTTTDESESPTRESGAVEEPLAGLDAQRTIEQIRKEKARQEARERELEKSSAIGAKYYDNQSTAPEANEADLRIARAPISTESRAARAEQGRALLRVFYSEPFRDVQLPAGLEQSLERGDAKAIETAQGLLESAEQTNRAESQRNRAESQRRARQQQKSIKQHQKESARILNEEAEADSEQFASEMMDSRFDDVEIREDLFNNLMDTADEQERQENAKNAELEQRAQKARNKALAPVSESKSRRKEQGRAIEHFLKAPSLKVASDKINATPGLMRGIREGSKQALHDALQIINDEINAQNERREIERREREAAEARRNEPSEQEKLDAERRADRRRRDVRDEQADETALSAQEEDIDRRYQKSQRASENAQQGLMQSTAGRVQNQRNPEPREETREETQENVTRREQPAQEGDRDVIDLFHFRSESNELNDVESTESTEQRPPRKTPQTEPQTEEPTQIEPPATEEKPAQDSKPQETETQKESSKQEKRKQIIQKLKDDLAQILDLDNHPNLKEYLHRMIELTMLSRESENLKKLKEWCDSQITLAKGIRDKGKIEEWEERAKERLPKPQPKPQPYTQKTAPADESNTQKTPQTEGLFTFEETRSYKGEKRYVAWIDNSKLPLGHLSRNADYNLRRIAETQTKQNTSLSGYYQFKSEEQRDEFIRKVQKSWYLSSEIERQRQIEKIINPAKEEAYRILEADKYPEIKDFLDRQVEKAIMNVDTVEDAEDFAKRIVSTVRSYKDAGKLANGVLWELGNKKFGDRWLDNRKYESKHEYVAEKVKQVENGEITLDEAYEETKHFLETGKRKVTGKTSKPKPKRKENKKDKLYEKFQADTHPHIKAHLDELFAKAADKTNRDAQKQALALLKRYEEAETPTEKQLNDIEERFKSPAHRAEQPESAKKNDTDEAPATEEKPAQDSKPQPQSGIKYLEPELYSRDKGNIENGRRLIAGAPNGSKIRIKYRFGNGEEHEENYVVENNKLLEAEEKGGRRGTISRSYTSMRNHFSSDSIQEIEIIEPDLRGEPANRFDRFTMTDPAGTTKPALGLKLNVDVVLRQVDGGIQKIKELVQRYGGKFIRGKGSDPLYEIYDPIVFENDKQLQNFRRVANKFLNDEVAKFYDEYRRKAQEEKPKPQPYTQKTTPAGKADITGTPNIDTSKVVAEKDLTPAQKLLVSFSKKLGVEVVFFNNPDGRFRGVHKGGKTFLNINGNKELGGVFWHESFHWLKNNNPELYKALVKAAGITDAQRRAYLETSKRTDLKSNEEIDEEILADMMDDVAKRTGLFQSIAGKNRGLIERAIQWFKDTLNKFIDHFRNPQGKLTTAQAQALASEFGRIANQLKDPNGNQIFRYNRRTHNVELADNRERTDAELAEMTAKNAQFDAKYSVDSNDNSTKSFKQRVKNLLGVEGKNIPIHKQMKRQLEDLSKMKIAADHLPEGVQVKIDKIAKVIRTGREYDWANILPEVGNAVAEQLGITQSAEMGNYIGKFILNGAPNDESAEAKEFAKAMRENTEMSNKVMAIRGTFDKWNNMSAEEQMIASTRYDKEIPPLRERAQKFWQYLRTELFDTQIPIHYHVAKFEKATGLKLADSINPEKAFTNLRGMQERAMRFVYGNEYTKEALQKMYPNVDFSNWKPMAMILESIKAEPGSQRYVLFDQFVKACHFLDIHRHNDNVLMQQGKVRGEIRKLQDDLAKADTKKKKAELERSIKKKEESLEALKKKIMDTPDTYTKDKCVDLILKYDDEFGEAQRDLVMYSRALLDIWVDSGMMDRKRYHQLLAAYPNYVPLHREFDENPNLNTADSMKHMLGSTKDVKDAIAAISNNTFDYIQRTEKNKAKLLLANLANFDGVGGIFELVDGSSPNDGTIIHFYENGKRKALQCSDEDIVKAVNSMNQPTMNLFLKVLQVPALMLRATATGLSPGFIAGNFLRDPQDAFMVSKSYHAGTKPELLKDFVKSLNPFVTWSYLLHAVGAGKLLDNKYVKKFDSKTLEEYLKNFDGKMLEEYRVSGAAQSDFFSFDRDYKAEAIERLTKKNLTRYASPKGVFEFLRKAGEMTELATRLYVYDRVKTDRAKKHGGINIYDDLVTAAFESRDFIDFARHGNAGRTWNTLTAFANPVLQGFDKQWRTYDFGQLKKFGGTEETQKNFCNSVARLFLKGILPAIVLSLLHKDEDWYKDDVQDWEKENYWIITETLRVPKGADLSLRFFSNLFERLISNDPVRADKVLQPLKGILPDLMPTAFLPIFECMANYDLFRRQPIVPQREVNKYKDTPELQYDSTNSKLAVLLGRVTGVSPRYIDHVIYGYTSGFGKEATHLIDTVTPGRHTAWTRSDVPFFSRILRTPYRAPKIVSEYYEEFGRQESYAQRLAWEKKHGNPNAKPSKEYDPALHRRLKNIQRAMQNLNAAERAIMDDPKLTSEQVEDKREEIQKRRVELCRKAFQRAQ